MYKLLIKEIQIFAIHKNVEIKKKNAFEISYVINIVGRKEIGVSVKYKLK